MTNTARTALSGTMSALARTLAAGVVLGLILPHAGAAAQMKAANDAATDAATALSHPYAGMWVTDDNRVRHELLPNGRYDEARGNRASAYQGRYEVTGTHIEYWDDTGFTADGDFVDADTLHHGGMILRRQR